MLLVGIRKALQQQLEHLRIGIAAGLVQGSEIELLGESVEEAGDDCRSTWEDMLKQRALAVCGSVEDGNTMRSIKAKPREM